MNGAAPCKVLPSGAELAAPMSPQSYAKPELMGPQNRRDGQHSDAIIKDFSTLLDNTQDSTHSVAIFSGTREFIKHKCYNKMYISDEQLHPMELCIHEGIQVQAEGINGECICQMSRCTGSQSWHGGNRWNDWVWVKQPRRRCYGTPNERLPGQLLRLFKIKLHNKDGSFLEDWLAVALTTIPENSGNLDAISKFGQVGKESAAIALQVARVGNIVGCTHGIPKIATGSKTGDGRNKRWIVHGHVDLETWNDVCIL